MAYNVTEILNTTLAALDMSTIPAFGPWVSAVVPTYVTLTACMELTDFTGTAKTITVKVQTAFNVGAEAHDLYGFSAQTADGEVFTISGGESFGAGPGKQLQLVRAVVTAIGNADNTGNLVISLA